VKRVLIVVSILCLPLSVNADPAPKPPDAAAQTGPAGVLDIRDGRSGGLFVAGALTGFLAHEAGHVLANLVYGNVPRLEGLWAFGFVPFFAISPRIDCNEHTCRTHDGKEFWGGPRGKFVITSAGYNVQHVTDEILLTHEPLLRYRNAPYRKGLLAFNTLLSVGYAVAAWTRTEDPHGDLSRSAKLAGLSSDLYAGTLILPAVLDLYRYFMPESRVAPWVSRGSKGLFLGLIFAAPK